MVRRAIYAGSFDCYTNGHHDISKKAARLFDELHIVIAINSQKTRRFPAEEMAEAIRESLREDGIDNCIITVCSQITADYCIENDVGYFVRGLRNSLDYNYEETIACANKLFAPELETIYLRAENAAISSSIVEEMFYYGKDISGLVPGPVYRLLLSLRERKDKE